MEEMSQLYYMKEWDVAQESLKFIINTSERPPKPEPLPKTLRDAFNRVCYRYAVVAGSISNIWSLVQYVQYISIYNQLTRCFDYMVHPQKRELIARCIDGVTGRIVELRHELFRIEMREYAPFGPFCATHQILPSDLEMDLSRTFAQEKAQRLQRRADLLDYILISMGKPDDLESASTSTPPPKQLVPDYNQRLVSSNYESQITTRCPSYSDQLQQNRIVLEKLRISTDRFLNLEYKGKPLEELEEVEQQVVSKRIQTAQEYEDEFVQRVILETETLKDSAGARQMEEDIKQNIMQWMLECREVTGNFPEYPGEDVGGSTAIFAQKTPEEVADELDFGQDEKARPKAKEKAKEKKPGKKAELPEGFVMKTSNFIDEILVDVGTEYDLYWKDRDESSNFKQEFCPNHLKERVNEGLENLLRQQIDEQMRQELEILTMAIEKTKMAKARPKKANAERKKKKKDKRKRLKDLTPNIDIEDLFAELVRNDIVKRIQPVFLKEYIGEMNLLAEGDSDRLECKPDLGDVKKMIFDFVILPMSNKNVREHAPCCKSLLIVGPRGSGKKMLVNAICTELGASLFDLTAANIHDKYTDRDGPQMLMHLVMKVGKQLEPSIIFIDDCEQMFVKKLPPEIHTNPGRMKSNLTKAMKTIGLDDRIMLIGTTCRPFNAVKGPLLKMYERIIFIYPPAYASRYTLWETMIRIHQGKIKRNLSLSTLSQISSSFTASDICNTVREVLTTKRLKRQATKNLQTVEFCDVLSESTPVYVEEQEALVTWLKETPQFKKRAEVRALEEAGLNIFDML